MPETRRYRPMIDVDPRSPVPLYLQMVEQIRRLMAMGALRPGDRLPPVRELAARARINRNTAARAIQTLEAQGLLRTRVGQGTFVGRECQDTEWSTTHRFAECLDPERSKQSRHVA